MRTALAVALSLLSVLIPGAIFWGSGYFHGARIWKGRAAKGIVHLHENLTELGPLMSVVGIGDAFDYAIVDTFGKPPKKLAAHYPHCPDCHHVKLWHRPTITVIATGDEVIGDSMPISANLVCHHPDCRCVRLLMDGSMEIEHVQHPDDDDQSGSQ